MRDPRCNILDRFEGSPRLDCRVQRYGWRNTKIPNKTSFGICDKGDSATNARIIAIASTACLIDLGAF